MLTQQVRKINSDGITYFFNREEGQNNEILTLCKWKHTCTYMECNEVMSPTMGTEGILLTTVIKAQEG